MQIVIDIPDRIYKTALTIKGTDKELSFEDKLALEIAVGDGKLLTDVLDKIRTEFVSLYPKNYAGEPELGGSSCEFSLNKVLKIIDKYKAEI